MKSPKPLSPLEIKNIILLKLFNTRVIDEQRCLELIEFPERRKTRTKRGSGKSKYLRELIVKLKAYEDTFPGHLEQLIKEAGDIANEHSKGTLDRRSEPISGVSES